MKSNMKSVEQFVVVFYSMLLVAKSWRTNGATLIGTYGWKLGGV